MICQDPFPLTKPRGQLSRSSSCPEFARAVAGPEYGAGAPLSKGLVPWVHRHNCYNRYSKNNPYDPQDRKSLPNTPPC
jgi:hypothetical protein